MVGENNFGNNHKLVFIVINVHMWGSMLHFVSTSLLESHSQTVVNTVNTVGVMGKGLAKHFGDKYPEMFREYKRYCSNGSLDIGKLWLWKAPDQWILNFPTKKHWRHPSKLEYVQLGLEKFVANYEERGITEISFPRLGCGNGGLDWEVVKPLMEKYLSKLPIAVYIHDYQFDIGLPEHNSNSNSKTAFFLKSFDSFLENLSAIILEKNHAFKTISENRLFQVEMDSTMNLLFTNCDPSKETSVIPKDDLYEAWQMLLNGPLTPDRLIGHARDQGSCLFGLLATLPYVRPIQIRHSESNANLIGLELIESLVQTELLAVE